MAKNLNFYIDLIQKEKNTELFFQSVEYLQTQEDLHHHYKTFISILSKLVPEKKITLNIDLIADNQDTIDSICKWHDFKTVTLKQVSPEDIKIGTVVLSGDLFFYNYLNTEYNWHSENFAVTVNKDFSRHIIKYQRFFFINIPGI